MPPATTEFVRLAARGLHDPQLAKAMARSRSELVGNYNSAVAALPEFEALCQQASEIKDHALQYLDYYLEAFEAQVTAHGGKVHWAATADEACRIVIDLCHQAGARLVVKGKSMVAEEMGLNRALSSAGIVPVETDLGEYIIQLANEPPSHIIAPALHKTREQIADLFHTYHARYGLTERHSTVPPLVNEARAVLREKFIRAEVGITGANFLVAETGSSVIVTNEGNGDLCSTLPRMHIVTAGIEKVIPTLADVATVLRVLSRSATGQETTVYTTFFTGPRRSGDLDGPSEYHVVLLDNGRSQMLGNEFRAMLRCIRCGACMNHCPVYQAVGGHAYGWVYPGPMGSVLTPLLRGLAHAPDLPHACTLNGHCEKVCPMNIPLPSMLRQLRAKQFEQRIIASRHRFWLGLWAFIAQRPRLYHVGIAVTARGLSWLTGRRRHLRWLPFMSGWTTTRDLPVPMGPSFHAKYRKHKRLADASARAQQHEDRYQ